MNNTPEQLVRYQIVSMLLALDWVVQSKKQINLTVGVAVCEYGINIHFNIYIPFVYQNPKVVIEANPEDEAAILPVYEQQTEGRAKTKLKLIKYLQYINMCL